MRYQVIIPKPVRKQLDRLPTEVQSRVIQKVAQLADNPRPSGTKKLKGFENEYRVRVGSYRIRYEVNDREVIILILSCKHRKDAYR